MEPVKDIEQKLLSVLEGGDIVFIVPPFGSIGDIYLAPHILHALSIERGYKAEILYLNMLLASVLGRDQYRAIYEAPLYYMLADRLFARSAYGLPPLGRNAGKTADEAFATTGRPDHVKMFHEAALDFDPGHYMQIEETCHAFIEAVVPVIASLGYKIAGCSTAVSGLTNCSVALLTGIKKYSPRTITIIGGSNCESFKAEGVASLADSIDYIFSGESENTFRDFLAAFDRQELPAKGILTAPPLADLDRLPPLDYRICLEQAEFFLGPESPDDIRVWYETSRGCWWADKSKCTFCGVPKRTCRQKSIAKVLRDLEAFKRGYPGRMLFMADDIIPPGYREELLPILGEDERYPPLGYQLRSNLSLQDLQYLKKAKTGAILPGIESFSTGLLKLMHKGVTGRQNLLLLRNAVCVGIYCDWFLLWGFPGDNLEDYEQVLEVLPLIRHLQPPREMFPVVFIPFSVYFERREEYKIENLRPWQVFDMIFPPGADVTMLANYFCGEFPSAAYRHPEIIAEIAAELGRWRKTWRKSRLVMNPLMGNYVINDNRELHEKEVTHVLDREEAKEIMTTCGYTGSRLQDWALSEKLGVVADSWYVPLVTASPRLLLEFEEI